MITKGGLEAITLSLAMEYAKDRIRFNAGRSRTGGYADARQRLEGILAKPIANGRDLGNPGHCRCGRLSDRRTSCHRGGAARGRRCTQRKMVNTEDKLAEADIELSPAFRPLFAGGPNRKSLV